MSTTTGGGGPCGACKFLRRKCVVGCIFAPYFDSVQGGAHFAAVHKVFGASNVSKLLLLIPSHKRLDAVVTISFEAQARLRDPVYGCVAHIFALQRQVVSLQAELAYLQAHLATLELPSPAAPPPLLPISMSSLQSSSSTASRFDLSSLFEAPVQPPSSVQQRQVELSSMAGGGDLHSLVRELLERGRSKSNPSPYYSPPTSEPPLSNGSGLNPNVR